jgi:regulator of sigma E protease
MNSASPNLPPPHDSESDLVGRDVRISTKGRSIWTNARFLAFLGFFVLVLVPLYFKVSFVSFLFAVLTFLEVVLLFNILIIVHELGHFLAAKKCGLVVDKFAIWFGKPLWSKKIDGVEYILGTIPAGGYVALPQMAPMEAIEGKTDTPRENLPPASPWQKIVVAFAGPLFSFGLALFFACIVWAVGKPVTYSEQTTTIGYVYPNGPAYKAGLRTGDTIKSIDGHKVRRWVGVADGVTWCIITSSHDTFPVVVDRAGQEFSFAVTPAADPDNKHPHWWQRAVPPKIMIASAEKSLIVDKIYPDSPASDAGITPGERLVALEGTPLLSYAAISQAIKDHPHAPLHLTIGSGNATWVVTLVPVRPLTPKVIPEDAPQTDIGIDLSDKADLIIVHPGPWIQITESANAVRGTLAALFSKNSKVGPSQLSGPLGIMNIFFAVLSSPDGWRLALWLAVLINVNLAMLNLLPLPVLDGGHILLSIIEWVRRRPLSMSILEPLQTGCALLLVSFILYVTFFDVQDSGKIAMNLDGDNQLRFAPKSGGQ